MLQGRPSTRSREAIHTIEGGHPHSPREFIHEFRGRSSTRSKGGYPHAPREVFHAIHPRAQRETIHMLRGRSSTPSMRSEGGDPHAPREVIHAIHPRAPREEEGDPHDSRGVIHVFQGRCSTRFHGTSSTLFEGDHPHTFRFLIPINPDSDSTLQPSLVLMLFRPTH